MEGEIQQPVPEPIPAQEQLLSEEAAQQPDLVIAPANPIDSEVRPGVADRLAQFKENPESLPQSRPRMADLEAKVFRSPDKECTKEEAFYLEHGWKAYLQEYPNGYALEDIAQMEKLAAGDIKNGIEERIIKDPKSIQLYGQIKLDSDKQYYTKWALDHIDDVWVQNESKLLIAATEQECLPLANGKTQDLLQYSNQQGEYRATEAKETTDDKQQATSYEAASNWYAMAAKLSEQRAKEKKLATTKTTDTTLEK
jgi:hypothetical protein